MNFSFELPTRIYFGTGILEEALEKEKRFLGKRIMIVTTGKSLVSNGYLGQLEEILKKTGVENVIIFDGISPNPKLDEVKEAILIGKDKDVDRVIGFGGGSALDAAKAAAVGISAKDSIEEYLLNGKEPSDETLPVIAIPTTAGTGSELSRGAILSSPAHNIKTGIRGKNIQPKVAIVDARYTWSVPVKVTMETGFDVLAHAIETYCAVKANCYSEMLSETAIKIVAEELEKLKDNLSDGAAREKMAYASMIMGMNLATIGTCLPHRMQYAIGAATDTSHASGLLSLYPVWIRHEYEVNQEKVRNVIKWLGYGDISSSDEAGKAINDFLNKLEINYKLKDLGINETMIEELTGQVTRNLANDKLSQKEMIVRKIFEESIG